MHDDPAIEVREPQQDLPGRRRGREGHRLRGRAPARCSACSGPNGAGKSTTIGMLTTTVAPTAGTRAAGRLRRRRPSRSRARRVSSVVFQDAVVDRALTGRRNLDIHARLWGVEPRATPGAHRRARRRARPRRPARPARRDLQRRPAPAARDRPRARLATRRCCSSTSRRSGSTRASATSCST